MDDNSEQSAGRGEMVRSLFVLLVLAGLAVGAMVAMEIRGRARRAGLVADNHDLRTQLAFVEAKHGEMVSLLGRPGTELVKLAGAKEWSGQALAVAWDPVQRVAVVLVDRLPAAPEGMVYRLRTTSGEVLGEVDAMWPARRVYAVPQNVAGRVGFEVTMNRKGEESGRVVFVPVRT